MPTVDNRLTFISLFSGFGGIDLGFESAGMHCVAQVENNEYASKILAKHWPHVLRYGDIRNVKQLPKADIIAGGFPCQNVSTLGNRVGITGPQSGLWREFARIVCALRPKYVFVENVPDLLRRGGSIVFRDLAAYGYDQEWICFPASAVGASHKRNRLAIVAYSARIGMEKAARQNWQSQCSGEISRGLDTFRKSRIEWHIEPNMGRMADGVPDWVERIKGLGNAVVPAWAEFIGKLIVKHYECSLVTEAIE